MYVAVSELHSVSLVIMEYWETCRCQVLYKKITYIKVEHGDKNSSDKNGKVLHGAFVDTEIHLYIFKFSSFFIVRVYKGLVS